MPEIHDDEFFQKYEAALIIYETSYDDALGIVIDFSFLPCAYPEHWTLLGPTVMGGGFRRRDTTLEWVYPGGLAIKLRPFLFREFFDANHLQEVRDTFYKTLERWRRNRY